MTLPPPRLATPAPAGSSSTGNASGAMAISPRKQLLTTALFFLTCCGTVLALDKFLPPTSERLATIKLDQLERSLEGTNVLLLGSSSVYHGLDPKVMDRVSGDAGLETKTFNLGIPAAVLAESTHLLERVAELEPQDLRWILVEAENVATVRDEAYYLTAKSIAWHSHLTHELLWPYFIDRELPSDQKLGVLWRSLVAFTYNRLGVGRGLPIVERSLGLGITPEERRHWLGPGRRGYRTITDRPSATDLRMRDNFQRNFASYKTRNTKMVRQRKASPPATDAMAGYFLRIEALAESMGARAIFHTRQGAYLGREVVGLQEAGRVESVLRLDNAKRFPELFDLAYTFDGNHLLLKGAEKYSEYMAQLLVRDVKRLGR